MDAPTPQCDRLPAARLLGGWRFVVCCCLMGCSAPPLNAPKSNPVMDATNPTAAAVAPATDPVPQGSGPLHAAQQVVASATAENASAGQPAGPVPEASKPPGERRGAEEIPAPRTLADRMQIPLELPGAQAPPIRIPSIESSAEGVREQIIDKLFPDRPPVPKLAAKPAGPTTLAQVEQLALANNPVMVQASADVTSAMGTAIQAGVHPNPTFGYESDTVGSFGTRNYQGLFGTQVIKTANKLGLARAIANINLMNAQLDMRRTRISVLARIKAGYYAVLVAQQNVAISEALAWFSNEAYRIQVDKLREGEAAPYEPVQLRTLAVQARSALVQAQNRYISAWKQLTATVGLPDLPTAELEGRADMTLQPIDYQRMLATVLNVHPDVLQARNLEAQARLQLQLQRVVPVPDINLYGTVQRDFTTPLTPRSTYNVQVGLPLPIWDTNKGNIMTAEGNLRRMAVQINRARLDLTTRTADAFERFESNRVRAQYLQDQILPDQARVYRRVYERHQQEPDAVGFSDIIVAQQNLAGSIADYIITLNAQWSALADIANLMQVEDFREIYSEQIPGVIVPNKPPADH
jgi:cobalt-zinc-cadmium efflux system outer membrane protein